MIKCLFRKEDATMSSDLATHTTSLRPSPPRTCPDCESDWIVWLAQLRQLDDSTDYYRCKNCGHEFSRRRIDDQGSLH